MIRAATPEAHQLFNEGAIALAEVEANGIRVDTEYLRGAIAKARKSIQTLEAELREDKVFKVWQRHYGSKMNLDSTQQLGKVLFTILKHPFERRTKSGKPKVDEKSLESVDLPFVKKYIRRKKFDKTASTFLAGILDEAVDGFLHPFYSLNIARTYRSSSDSPNFQNFPVRDEELAKMVRSAFIARDGHILIENDFKGIEVCGAACYNKDPVLIQYIIDPSRDMHRDMAAEIYKLKQDGVSKMARYCAKNQFVFPEFYGSFYKQCATDLWDAIDRRSLTTDKGTPLKTHLARKGITELGDCDFSAQAVPGTFEYHLQQVEKDFWGRRFKVYANWKKSWYEKYLKIGGFHTLTGFWIEGSMSRREVINYPIQGSAFHCLLWCLIQLTKKIKKYKMQAKVVGQIHDSILSDVPIKEKDNYLEMVKQIVEVDLPKHYKWIIVPMTIETEICPEGGSWFQKKEVKV